MGFLKRLFQSNTAYFSLDEMIGYVERDSPTETKQDWDRVRNHLRSADISLNKSRPVEDLGGWAREAANLMYLDWPMDAETNTKRRQMAVLIVLLFEIETGLDIPYAADEAVGPAVTE